MEYSLAKKLKNAGYPESSHADLYCTICKEECPCCEHVGKDLELITIPTLEELIEACGDEFDSLIQNKTRDGIRWNAESKQYRGHGFTPSEAVANLYLALHAPK